MRDLRECSGPWKGLWVQRGVRGTMSLRLTISDTRIVGSGRDTHGRFTIVGAYLPRLGRVVLRKRYIVRRAVYRGVWNGSFISGVATVGFFPFHDTGTFELWPESEEATIESLASATAPASR